MSARKRPTEKKFREYEQVEANLEARCVELRKKIAEEECEKKRLEFELRETANRLFNSTKSISADMMELDCCEKHLKDAQLKYSQIEKNKQGLIEDMEKYLTN
ncbi:hypothetical protein Ciccas_008020 [Cichlidogyrus casuarinus]|uniref:Uncharacterized protein n=1 Tax=Cichlidogyrus casuarinus TaxID=1844966 RepID=A0ABD2Q171_9PLAT